MTKISLSELKKKAESANTEQTLSQSQHMLIFDSYVNSANPETVLILIDQLEKMRAALEVAEVRFRGLSADVNTTQLNEFALKNIISGDAESALLGKEECSSALKSLNEAISFDESGDNDAKS